MSRHATILATSRYIPTHEVSNASLAERFADGPGAEIIAKLERKTGIGTRYYADPDQVTSDLALEAATIALQRAGLRATDLDLIILGTDSPDYLTPATSVVLQHKLGATRAGTFDIGCACASFPTGVATASALITANPGIDKVLVVGAYLMQRLADPMDPMVFFYGDGAGAAILGAAEQPGVIASAFGANGSYHSCWGIYSGGTSEPASEQSVRAGRTRVRIVDKLPASVNNEGWPSLVRDLAERGGFDLAEIGTCIFTQVRKDTIFHVMDALGLPRDRAHLTMARWGYTGSACVPIALDDAIEQRKVRRGDLVILVGSGVGYNQAGVALRY